MKGKTHDLNHDLIFSAHTINCVCHSLRSMFRVLGVYNFAFSPNTLRFIRFVSSFGAQLLSVGPVEIFGGQSSLPSHFYLFGSYSKPYQA